MPTTKVGMSQFHPRFRCRKARFPCVQGLLSWASCFAQLVPRPHAEGPELRVPAARMSLRGAQRRSNLNAAAWPCFIRQSVPGRESFPAPRRPLRFFACLLMTSSPDSRFAISSSVVAYLSYERPDWPSRKFRTMHGFFRTLAGAHKPFWDTDLHGFTRCHSGGRGNPGLFNR